MSNSGVFSIGSSACTSHPNSNAGLFQRLDEQITTLLQLAYEQKLGKEQLMLSRLERQRLYRQLAKAVLERVQGLLGGDK